MSNADKFIEWMKSKGAWKSFVNCHDKSDPLEIYFREVSPPKYIWQAFVWRWTSHGHKYWEKLNDEWLDFIDGD